MEEIIFTKFAMMLFSTYMSVCYENIHKKTRVLSDDDDNCDHDDDCNINHTDDNDNHTKNFPEDDNDGQVGPAGEAADSNQTS